LYVDTLHTKTQEEEEEEEEEREGGREGGREGTNVLLFLTHISTFFVLCSMPANVCLRPK
jgi:hypothetical protein